MQPLQCLQPSFRAKNTSKNHYNFVLTERPEITILMQLGGKYFGWENPEVSQFEQVKAATAMLAGYRVPKGTTKWGYENNFCWLNDIIA